MIVVFAFLCFAVGFSMSLESARFNEHPELRMFSTGMCCANAAMMLLCLQRIFSFLLSIGEL
jgi:hypothetical protein